MIIEEQLKRALEEESQVFETFYRWLEKNFPSSFFEEVPTEWISLIVHALVGFKVQDFFSEIHLKDSAISLILNEPKADLRILKRFPLYGIKNYTTYVSKEPLPYPEIDQPLRIALIYFTDAGELRPIPVETKEELTTRLLERHPTWTEKSCHQLIDAQDPSFLRTMPTERQLLALEMFERAQTRDHCQLRVHDEESAFHLIIAWKNTPKHNFLYRLARVIYHHNLVMKRVQACYLNAYEINSILMLSVTLQGRDQQPAWEAADIEDFLQEIVMLKYFGSLDLVENTFIKTGLLRGNLGNFLRTAINFVHQILVNLDAHRYTIEQITEGLCRHPELTVELCRAFEHKFHPTKHDLSLFEKTKEHFLHFVAKLDTGHEQQDELTRNVLLQSMNFVHHTLKCNFYRKNKSSLSFRLDPHYLEQLPFERMTLFPELPFAIFFIKGMHFLSFHIRFQDLARGGLRTVYIRKQDKIIEERNTLFIECYNLALTQHKKNKDIPEGGAKGVIFLKPYQRLEIESDIFALELKRASVPKEEIKELIARFQQEQTLEYLYQTQRSFIDSFLTILNCNDDGSLKAKHIVDYYRKPEYVYLGPDENMHDGMIEWIAARSIKVGYRPLGAFISSKPSCGINHKEYGVTSLGVNVYMEKILRFLKIDPTRDKFTVKMTGGPDGDVAGNQIYNLYRFYPKTAKLLALTDISGTIFDPNGVDLETMVSLFKNQKPIRFYPAEKLSRGGFLLDRETKRENTPYIQETLCWCNREGELFSDWLSGSEMNALFRNNVHQTKCDVFLPCGGRPKTLHETNYKEFLDEKGEPTAKAIVEGANLYLSSKARLRLEELGLLIIKDSSANKGGVICSSFEVLAGLVLHDDEFLQYKEQLVEEILGRLKDLASKEAELLIATHQRTKKPCTEISDEISARIIFFTNQILQYLEKVSLSPHPKDPLVRCFLEYCPQLLQRKFQDRLLSNVPENHKKAIIASHLASQLVYTRGLDWFPSLIDILPLLLEFPK